MHIYFLNNHTRRIKKSDYSLSLFSERYVKVSLHTAQAFHNPCRAAVFISITAFVIPVCSLLTHYASVSLSLFSVVEYLQLVHMLTDLIFLQLKFKILYRTWKSAPISCAIRSHFSISISGTPTTVILVCIPASSASFVKSSIA